MECSKGKLCTRLTDTLCSDDSDNFSLLHHLVACKVTSVALGADSLLAFAGEYASDLDGLDREALDLGCNLFCDFLTGSDDQFTVGRVINLVYGCPSEDSVVEGFYNFVLVLDFCSHKTSEGSAVFLSYDNIVRNVHEPSGQVTSVSCLHSGISQTLTGAVSGDEVLQN